MRGKDAYSEEVWTQSPRGDSGTQSEKYIRGYTAAQDHGNCGRLRLGKILARTRRALRCPPTHGGVCAECGDTGIVRVVDESTLVLDDSISINEGAGLPW